MAIYADASTVEKQKTQRWIDRKRALLRGFPSFVVHAIEEWGSFVVGLDMLVLKDLGFVEQLVVEAKDTLVLSVSRE